MNIFLTGSIQVGKSTIINRFIETHPDLNIGGFKTLTNFNENKGVYRGVYIVPACESEPNCISDCHIGTRALNKQSKPENFDLKGVEILNADGDYDLILMDEIGFMETQAKVFCENVMKFLDGKTPVIGVVKPMMKGLPLAVKQHKNTKVLEVTKENRESVYFEFEELLEKQF